MTCLIAFFLLLFTLPAQADDVRAADGDEVVLRRLYPKAQTYELAVGAGFVLNPTFVDTQLLSLSARYHWSESWGVGLTIAAARTKDRAERACVESFYNDPDHAASAPCASEDGGDSASGTKVNLGPAYAPIRELKSLAAVSADYTIAYGKQIILTGAVMNFDLRLRFGAGVLQATVYDERSTVRGSDRASRGDPATSGVGVKDRDSVGTFYGVDGRPEPRAETAPLMLVGVVEEMFFLKRFFVAGELTWYGTTGISGGVDHFFVAELGGGVKI